MKAEEIKDLRKKIGVDPILTDEEIEYIWMAMDKEEAMKPLCGQRFVTTQCPACELHVGYLHDYCCSCGQRLDWEDEE